MQAHKLNLPRTIGHRGARGTAPENTLLGIKQAKNEGCNWIEIDIKLTADNIPILFHDNRLDELTNATGHLANKTYTALQDVIVMGNSKTTSCTTTDKIPTLKEALELIIALDLNVNLEIKPCKGREIETAEIALKLAQDIWPKGKSPPLISSFKDASLETAMQTTPNWPRAFLMNKKRDDWQERLTHFKAVSFNIWDKLLDEKSINHYQSAGLPLVIFTVNDAKRAAWLFEHNIKSVFTDYPQRLKMELKALQNPPNESESA